MMFGLTRKKRWILIMKFQWKVFHVVTSSCWGTCYSMFLCSSFHLAAHDWYGINTLRPRQNGHRFADDTFKRIFFNENVRISIKISLKFVPKGPIDNNPALVQIMAWRRSGDKPLSEPMMVSLLTHICVTRPQWVNISVFPLLLALLSRWTTPQNMNSL